MPRISAISKNLKSNIQIPTNSWIFCLKEEVMELSEEKSCNTNMNMPVIETLRHPSTNESSIFLFSPSNNLVQEILTYSDSKRCWFIDDSVKSDGSMRLSTPIDPLFLVLPYLKKYCNDKAIPLDQLLQDDDYPATSRLLQCNGLKYLSMVADKKGNEDIIAFKYNEEKTLTWLKKKTTQVAEVLKKRNIHLNSSKSVSEDPLDEWSYLRYAVGIVSDYLNDDLKQKLVDYLNLPKEQSILKRNTNVNQDNLHDKKKFKPSEEMKKPTLKVLKSLNTSKKKIPAKKAMNTKSISSYFTQA